MYTIYIITMKVIIFIILNLTIINANYEMLYIKNSILKKLINNDYYKFKLFAKKIREIKTTTLTNYYNGINWYYSLSDDDKLLLETVFSLNC